MEDTPARRAALSVTVPYFEFREVLAVRASEAGRFRTLADFRGRRVGTLAGTMAWEILVKARAEQGILPVSYDDDVHPYEDLARGRLDAVLLDHVLAARSLKRVPGLAILPETVATGRYVGVLAKENDALRDAIDGLLKDMMRDGTLRKIFEKWNVWDEEQAASKETLSRSGTSEEGFLRMAIWPTAAAQRVGQATMPRRERAQSRDQIFLFLFSFSRHLLSPFALPRRARHDRPLVRRDGARGRPRDRDRERPHLRGRSRRAPPSRATWSSSAARPCSCSSSSSITACRPSCACRPSSPRSSGLGLNYAAYESEIYRGALEAVPKGQLEAARTLGLTEGQVLRLVRGPQAFRLALAPMTNDFVALLKDSSLVSVVTVVELTKQTAIFATNIGSWALPGALCAALYLAMSLPLSRLARRLEGRWRAASS